MFFKSKQELVEVELKRPDGLSEWCSFVLPKELNEFIKYNNAFCDKKGYNIKLTKTSTDVMLANMQKHL